MSTLLLYEGFTGRRFPTNRGSALWPVNVRIGGLMPDRKDHWWEVNSVADANVIGEEVAVALRQYGLPFFEGLGTREQLAGWVQELWPHSRVFPAQVPLILATLAAERGDVLEATTLLRGAAAGSRGKPFESTVRRVASTLGVPLDDA